jgi:adenylate cyclase
MVSPARLARGGVAWLAGPLLVVLLGVGGVSPYTRGAGQDLLFWTRGAVAPRTPVTIVTVDDGALRALGARWPLSRELHATAIRNLAAARPLAIGVDVLFSEPSDEHADAALEAAIRDAGIVVLAASISHEAEKNAAGRVIMQRIMFVGPLRPLARAAIGVGLINEESDEDGVVRRAQIGIAHVGEGMPSFAGVLARIARERGRHAIRVPDTASVLVNFRGGPGTFPRLPFDRVVRNEFSPGAVRDRIVLVGVTSPSLRDVLPTPFARNGDMPGVEMHANAIDTLLAGDMIFAPSPLVTAMLAVAASLLATALVTWWPERAMVIGVGFVLVDIAAGVVLFRLWHLAAPMLDVVIAFTAGFVSAIVGRQPLDAR